MRCRLIVSGEDSVGDGGGFDSGANVVDAQDVGSGQDGSDGCGVGRVKAVVPVGWVALKDGGERGSVREGVGEEALTRGSDEDGELELAEIFEMGEDGVVFVEALAEAQ